MGGTGIARYYACRWPTRAPPLLGNPPVQELSTEAPNISEDAVQLMKFHGSYMQVRPPNVLNTRFDWLTMRRARGGASRTARQVALLCPPARCRACCTPGSPLCTPTHCAGQPRGAHVWRGQVVPVYDAHAAARGLRHQPAVPGDGRAGGPGEASITVYLDAARTETCCQLYLVMDELADLVSLSLLLCLPCTARILACRCRSRCLSPPLQLRCGMLLLHCMLPPPLLLLLPCMLPPPPPLHLLLSAQLLCRALLLSAETPCVLLSSLPCSTATARCA